MRTLFVTGAGTGIGKTYVTCALIDALLAQGLTVDAFKPVTSGFDPALIVESDPGCLLEALGRDPTLEAVEAISPLRFAAPLSPPAAARREGRLLAFNEVAAPCRARLGRADVDVLLFEGAGGVMSPIAEEATNRDLIAEIGAPAILVCGSYLGTITHSLTALEALRARGCEVTALVVCEGADGLDLEEITAELRQFTGSTPVVALPRFGGAGAVLPFLVTAR